MGAPRRWACSSDSRIENAGAFADDEAVALGVEGAAGALRLVIARGERAHGGESADAHGSDGGFGAAADHDVGIAAVDDAEGVADGVGGSGAGGGGGGIRAAGAIADGNEAGGEIDDGRGNEEGMILPGPPCEQLRVLALDDVESADAGADVDAGAIGDLRA